MAKQDMTNALAKKTNPNNHGNERTNVRGLFSID